MSNPPCSRHALVVNSIALYIHRRANPPPDELAA